jgi:hypothetical protein
MCPQNRPGIGSQPRSQAIREFSGLAVVNPEALFLNKTHSGRHGSN